MSKIKVRQENKEISENTVRKATNVREQSQVSGKLQMSENNAFGEEGTGLMKSR
jgi:hypothetical protein